MELISHPFRLRPNGTVYTVDQNSGDADAQQVAMILLTKIGERQAVPGFGVTDYTFAVPDVNQIVGAISLYYPGVTLENVKAVWEDNGFLRMEIEF